MRAEARMECEVGSHGYVDNRHVIVREIRDGLLVVRPEEFTRVNDHRREDRCKLLAFACHVDTFTAGEAEQQLGSRCLHEIRDLVREGVLRGTGIRRPNSEARVLMLPRESKPGVMARLGLV